ncbi:MAG: response regulator [Bacteroidetes bacterium]|nr:response regulator [Bacteroidota bacterium]
MSQKLNILHVDDSEKILSLLKPMLTNVRNAGTINTATTLEAAKKIMNRQTQDVVILDVYLPDGLSLDFLKWIKAVYQKTCVIMLSNHSDEFFRTSVKKLGADYFFDKSTEFEQIPYVLSLINKQ